MCLNLDSPVHSFFFFSFVILLMCYLEIMGVLVISFSVLCGWWPNEVTWKFGECFDLQNFGNGKGHNFIKLSPLQICLILWLFLSAYLLSSTRILLNMPQKYIRKTALVQYKNLYSVNLMLQSLVTYLEQGSLWMHSSAWIPMIISRAQVFVWWLKNWLYTIISGVEL